MYSDSTSLGVDEGLIRQLGSLGLPECVRSEGSECFDCQFGDSTTCPLLAEPDMRSYYAYLAENQDRYLEKRQKKVEALRRVYENWAVPLHWEIAARIVMEEEPNLFPSQDSVRGLIFSNEVTFSHLGGGVFELAY